MKLRMPHLLGSLSRITRYKRFFCSVSINDILTYLKNRDTLEEDSCFGDFEVFPKLRIGGADAGWWGIQVCDQRKKWSQSVFLVGNP